MLVTLENVVRQHNISPVTGEFHPNDYSEGGISIKIDDIKDGLTGI